MIQTVYISCPMTVSKAVLDDVITMIHRLGVGPYYWAKGSTYNEPQYQKLISLVNGFILILPDLAWSIDIGKMTSGSRKELLWAIQHELPIYLAYKNRTDGYGIYATEIQWKENTSSGKPIPIKISGIASTRYNFVDEVMPKDRPTTNRVKELFRQGMSYEDICRFYNIASYEVERFLSTKETPCEESKAIDQMYAGADLDIALSKDKFLNLETIAYSRDGKPIKAGVIKAGDVEYKPDNRILLLL